MERKFSFYVKQFLAWAIKCRHATTVNVYRHYFRRFKREVGDLQIRKITPSVLTAWAETWHASQAMVRLMRWCVQEAQIIKSNPLEHVQHPPKGERKRTLTAQEEKQLLAAAAPDLRTLLIGYRETMARPGELRVATWADMHPKTTPAKLRAALLDGTAFVVLWTYKNRKRRRLPNEPRVILVSPTAGKILCRTMPAVSDVRTPLFTTAAGGSWSANALRCRLRRLRRRLAWIPDGRGENIVPYTFRHTSATEATAFGIRDRLLADILGHTETATTARYQHLQCSHLQRALKKFWASRSRRSG